MDSICRDRTGLCRHLLAKYVFFIRKSKSRAKSFLLKARQWIRGKTATILFLPAPDTELQRWLGAVTY